MPKLSIVVPVYNAEQYLNQCLDSILAQSFTDFELILVDDGSGDQSGVICDQYACMDSRVLVIHTENQGVVTARRTGVSRAQGEYTAFVDSDDWLDRDFYRCIFEEGDGVNADILICSRVNRAAGCVSTTSFAPGYYDKEMLERTIFPQMIYDMGAQRYRITPTLWDKIFRTELLREVYEGVDPHITLGEDAICTYPFIARSRSLQILENTACYHYRENHISMVNQCDIRLLERVHALAVNMNQQFSGMPEIFNSQVKCFLSYNGLYAAHQILMHNRSFWLCKRIRAVKDLWAKSIMAQSFKEAAKADCSKKLKWKLRFARKNHPYLLYLLLRCNLIYQHMKPE